VGTLKLQALNMRDWKMRHQTAEMENAYITGTYGTKMQDWKMQEDRRIAAITTMDY